MKNLNSIRTSIRNSEYLGCTSGLAPNLVQGNLVIMEESYANEFIQYCRQNPKPCPVIGVSKAGDVSIPELCDDLDIRVDVPEYCIFQNGELKGSVPHIKGYWNENMVSIVLGCSFSFEDALIQAGLNVRNIDMGVNVSMFETNVATQATENFSGNMVVSMRPYKQSQIEQVVETTEPFTMAHGAPVHIGNPEGIGVTELNNPQYGSPVTIKEDEIPVFWGCGVTTQKAIEQAQLPLVITHAPGKMLITDRTYSELSNF